MCKQCGISTADYDLFLNHSLTFCRSNLLGKSCYYCTSLGEECQCLVVAKDIFGKVREVAKEAQAKELYSSDFFTTMLQYHCNAQFQLEQTDEFQFIMALQTNAQRTQFTLDNMPKFQIQGTKIACILWEMNENISEIKSIHLPFFDDMLQVEIWTLKKLDVIRQGCIELACIALFNS